jgi:hypothetical protein
MICVDSTCKIDTVFFEEKHIPVITTKPFSDEFANELCKLVNKERQNKKL